jgi:OmpA family
MRFAGLFPAFVIGLVLPVSAEEFADDPLAAVPVMAATEISFTPGTLLLTSPSHKKLQQIIGKGRDTGCYWLARGRNNDEARTLQAALAEDDIPLETIAIDVRPSANNAEARLYCAPPPVVTAYFLPGSARLTEEARRILDIAAAGHWNSRLSLIVRGHAGSDEAPDPLKLGLDRAQAARAFLIELGLAPKRLALEANTQASGHDALRVEVVPREP